MHAPSRFFSAMLPWLACVLACACGDGGQGDDDGPVYVVMRGPLAISIRERGELRAALDTRVSSELEGRNTLIYLIDEGTTVAAGDKLAELDASAIEEKRSSEAISVARARAALDQARKNVEIVEKELTAAESTAESRLKIARMRAERLIGQREPEGVDAAALATARSAPGTNAEMVAKLRELVDREAADSSDEAARHAGLPDEARALFGDAENLDLQMGEMANKILVSINDINLARSDLELASETLLFSRKLNDRGFLTKNELDRDELDHQRKLSEVTIAWNALDLLVRYLLPESIIETSQEVENAQLGLESVRASNEARRVGAVAELESSEAEFALAEERLANWTDQIAKAVMVAPTPGLVVYGRWDWDEPVFEGMEVRQRQEIVILPDVRHMVTELKVHEAQIDKAATGQVASIKVDAFPGSSFRGHVTEVSTLPDPAPSYRNDVKVYSVEVALDAENTDGSLRPGMNATVEIDVGTLKDVLSVPLPTIERRGDEHWVWRAMAQGPQPVRVALGVNNLTHVEVLSGLSEGDAIYLARPRGVELPGSEGAPANAVDRSNSGGGGAQPMAGERGTDG